MNICIEYESGSSGIQEVNCCCWFDVDSIILMGPWMMNSVTELIMSMLAIDLILYNIMVERGCLHHIFQYFVPPLEKWHFLRVIC